MRNIAIIGAGQSGLQLGLGLLQAGYSVTLYSDRTAEQLRTGRILSNQGMFHTALQCERDLGLNYWDTLCPQNNAVTFTLTDPLHHTKILEWCGRTNKPYQSVDQRLKFARWLEEFSRLGGNLKIQKVEVDALDKIALNHELTLIASGKGQISQCFVVNPKRSRFNKPQRVLSCLYVRNVTPILGSLGVRPHVIPEIGDFFTMPGLTLNGHCEMMLFEGIPGGPFDCWDTTSSGEEQLEIALGLLKKYLPWEAARFENAELTDAQATLLGAYTPLVKMPTFELPCGKSILGIGDTVVLNDPIAGQGANNASKAADLYLKRIIERGTAPFSNDWMQETFEQYWQTCAKWATEWSNMLLLPPPPHIIDLLSAATEIPEIANLIANAFDNPSILFPWALDAEETKFKIDLFKNERKCDTMNPIFILNPM